MFGAGAGGAAGARAGGDEAGVLDFGAEGEAGAGTCGGAGAALSGADEFACVGVSVTLADVVAASIPSGSLSATADCSVGAGFGSQTANDAPTASTSAPPASIARKRANRRLVMMRGEGTMTATIRETEIRERMRPTAPRLTRPNRAAFRVTLGWSRADLIVRGGPHW